MPLTFADPLLDDIGAAIWRGVGHRRPVHLVVVATSGFGMGLAAVRADAGNQVLSVTMVKRDFGFDTPDLKAGRDEDVVVLDNSIHSGGTATRVLSALRRQQAPASTMITLLGSMNAGEEHVRRSLESGFGVTVRACAPWEERHLWLRS